MCVCLHTYLNFKHTHSLLFMRFLLKMLRGPITIFESYSVRRTCRPFSHLYYTDSTKSLKFEHAFRTCWYFTYDVIWPPVFLSNFFFVSNDNESVSNQFTICFDLIAQGEFHSVAFVLPNWTSLAIWAMSTNTLIVICEHTF